MNADPSSASNPAPAGPTSSLVGRLANVFVAPGDVFAEVKASPVCHANWYVPAIVFVLASWCAAGLIFSQPTIRQQMEDVQEQAMQKQFQKQIDAGKMTQAQADQIKANAANIGGMFQKIALLVAPIFSAGVLPFWGGFVLWAGATLIFKQPIDFMKAVEVSGLALVIVAAGALARGLLAAAMGNMFVSVGPALLLNPFDATNPIHTTLLSVEIFGLWSLAVKSVGLAKLANTSLAKAAAWVFGVWIALAGGMLALGLAAQRLAAGLAGQH
jgi:hypothetical protein